MESGLEDPVVISQRSNLCLQLRAIRLKASVDLIILLLPSDCFAFFEVILFFHPNNLNQNN